MDIVRKEALELIREHVRTSTICLTTHNIMDWSLQPESLQNQYVDDKGCVWITSEKAENELTCFLQGKMELFYCNRAHSTFLSLVGFAQCISWEEAASLHGFPFHVDYAQRLVRFQPTEAFYWDDRANDMVPFSLFESVYKQGMVA